MEVKNRINLIFDFDGTLVDSFNAVMSHLNLLAVEFNFKKINENEVNDLRNLTTREIIRYLNIPFYKIPRIIQRGRSFMSHQITSLASFATLPEVLTELSYLNCSMGIVTSNTTENVTLWLEQHKLRHLFDYIHNESSCFGKKNIIKNLIKRNKMDKLKTFYIGDETRDIDAANQCNISSIAVLWGFNSELALKKSNPNIIAKTPNDMLTIISNLISDN